MRSILRETTFAPPKALRQLAEISDFDLFVTTTFDSLLEKRSTPSASAARSPPR